MGIDRFIPEWVALDFEFVEAVELFGPGLAIPIDLVVHVAVAVVVGGLDPEAVHGIGDAFLVFDVVVVEVAVSPGLDALGAGFDAVPTEKPLAAVAPGLLDEKVAGVGEFHAVSEGVGLLDHVAEVIGIVGVGGLGNLERAYLHFNEKLVAKPRRKLLIELFPENQCQILCSRSNP